MVQPLVALLVLTVTGCHLYMAYVGKATCTEIYLAVRAELAINIVRNPLHFLLQPVSCHSCRMAGISVVTDVIEHGCRCRRMSA